MSFTVIPVSENLARFVSARVAGIGGADFSRLIVVFPTARLGQHFRRELAEKVGACLPPRVTTLDGLIGLLSPSLAFRRISGLERSLLLRYILKSGVWKRLGPGMEPLIVDFYREMARAGHSLGQFALYDRLESAFRENPLGSEDYALYWSQCVRELKKLAEGYFSRLGEMGWEDGELCFSPVAPSSGLKGVDNILVCGFYDAAPRQVAFLKEVVSSTEFIYQYAASPAFEPVRRFAALFGHDLDNRPGSSPPALLGALDGLASSGSRLPELEKFRIFSLPSLAAEARQAKYEALKAWSRGDSVLVVVPRQPGYVSVFSAVFAAPVSDGGDLLPVGEALARGCGDDPAVQLLSALLDLAVFGVSGYHLASFLQTPGAWGLMAENAAEGKRLVHLLKLFIEDRFFEDFRQLELHLREWDPPAPEEKAVLREALGSLVRLLDAPPTLGGLSLLAFDLFSRCCSLFPPGELDRAIRSRVRLSLELVARLDRRFPVSGSGAEHLALLRRSVLFSDVYADPQPFRGVQLVHPLEARFIPADTVIVCGMNEGSFPAALPARLLEDVFVRRRFGLITPDRLEELEELSFFSLVVSPRTVVLTRCPQAGMEEEAESRFLTRVRLAGRGYLPPVDVGSRGDNRLRELSAGPEKNPRVPGPGRAFLPAAFSSPLKIGAYDCESLLKCPYRFYLAARGVEEGPVLKDDPDRRVEGVYLHKILYQLWTEWEKNGKNWGEGGLENRLTMLAERLLPSVPAFAGLKLRLQYGAWKRFRRRLEGLLASWRPWAWEKKIRSSFPAAGLVVEARGRVDFIGRGAGGEAIVVDFKSGTVPKAKMVRSLLSPQLPFYSLVLGRSGEPVKKLGYVSFLSRKEDGWEMEEGGLGRELEKKLVETLENISAAGGVEAAPEDGFCRYCPYPGVCRVSGKGALAAEEENDE